jgi:hypothetical protein
MRAWMEQVFTGANLSGGKKMMYPGPGPGSFESAKEIPQYPNCICSSIHARAQMHLHFALQMSGALMNLKISISMQQFPEPCSHLPVTNTSYYTKYTTTNYSLSYIYQMIFCSLSFQTHFSFNHDKNQLRKRPRRYN